MWNSTSNSGFAFSIHKFGSNPKAAHPFSLRWGQGFLGVVQVQIPGLLAQFFSFFGLPYVGCRQGKPATFINGMVVHNTATGRQPVAFGAILQPLTCISASPCFHAMLAFARYLMDLWSKPEQTSNCCRRVSSLNLSKVQWKEFPNEVGAFVMISFF